MLRSLGIIAIAGALLTGSAGAQTFQVSASGSVSVSATWNCMTTQWSITAPFQAGTTGPQLLAAVQAQLVATPAFLSAGGSASIVAGTLIINPGSDPNVFVSSTPGCGPTPLAGAVCNGLSFAVIPFGGPIPTMPEWMMIFMAMLLLGGGMYVIKRRNRAVVTT